MKHARSLKLSFWLPCLILLAFIVLLGASTWINYQRAETHLVQSHIEFVQQDMASLQSSMEREIQNDEWQEAKQALSARGVNMKYELLLAMDKYNTIIHATNLSLIGRKLDQMPLLDLNKINQARENNRSNVYLNDNQQKIFAYFPLKLDRKKGTIRDINVGSLVLVYDLKGSQALLWKEVWQSTFPLAIVLLLVMSLITVFLRTFLFKPIKHLIVVSEEASNNLSTALCELSGRGELAALANMFNAMLVKRRLYDHKLECSHTQITQALADLADQKYALDQHAIVAVTNIHGTITYVNEKFIEISGYSQEELIGSDHRLIKSGLHKQCYYEEMYSFITQGKVWQGEFCNKSKCGELRWFDTTIVPFMAGGKNPKSYIAIRTDITARKQAEGRWQFALEGARDGVWDWDTQTNKVFFSKRWKEMLGYKEAEIGDEFEEWDKRLYPGDKEKCYQDLNAHLEGKTSYYENEHRVLCKNGSYKWILDRGQVITWSEDKKPLRVIGTHQDISQRKQTEKILQSAQKMEAVGQLTGGIAHDFNNTLGVIIGNLELLAMQLDGDVKAQKRITAATKSAQRAADLTQQLLNFSRQKEAQSHVSNINLLVRDMDQVLQHSVGHRIDLSYKLYESLWGTAIDVGDFSDALLNLIINARDAMPEGGQVFIETLNCQLDDAFCQLNAGAKVGEYVQLSISDDGEGIEKSLQDKIFEPFFTTKSQGKGTGLGLSMVFGFVKRSKGYIKVYSEIGFGTTFRLYLPRNKSLPRSQNEVPNQSSQNGATAQEQLNDVDIQTLIGHEKLLLVDDEKGLLDLAQHTLEGLGYQVLRAATAQEAVDILCQCSDIALVFSDVVMPGKMTGFDLAERINNDFVNTKVLLTSGYTDKTVEQHNLVKFSFELLSKPYTQMDMALQIRKRLDDSNSGVEKTKTLASESAIVWTDEFLTGIDAIDEDHRHLFSLLAKLQKINTQGSAVSMAEAFKGFIAFIDRHFKREELIMNICEDPYLNNHQQVHRLLLKQVKAEQEMFIQGEISAKEVLEFFFEWFSSHIKNFDMDIHLSASKDKEQVSAALEALDCQLKGNSNHE